MRCKRSFTRRCIIFSPRLNEWITQSIQDPRDPHKKIYPLATLVWTGLLMFLNKIEARRQITHRFHTEEFVNHLNVLSQAQCKRVAHGDTLAYLMEKISPVFLSRLRTRLIRRLFRMRCLEGLRFLDRYWLVAVDSTGYLVFHRKHCRHCLVRKSRKEKRKIYLHPVLEAKIIFNNGLALSLETEFIYNSDGNTKQDCELAAFYRLTSRLKKLFPQLPLCLSLDSLYAKRPVLDLCEKNHWKYLISFRRGSMRSVFGWYEKMLRLYPRNTSTLKLPEGGRQLYRWIDSLEHFTEKRTFSFLECLEEKPKTKTCHFVWLTNLNLTEKNHQQIANSGGRLRWKIENEGFNMQKNGGYRLEHPYSTHEVGMKNFYLLLQIAHIFAQLMEKGSLLRNLLKKSLGSLRNIAYQLLEDLRCRAPDPAWFSAKIQVRFLDSS